MSEDLEYIYEPDVVKVGDEYKAVLYRNEKPLLYAPIPQEMFNDDFPEDQREEILKNIAREMITQANRMEAKNCGEIID